MIGKTISHYRILEKLGGGGMGVVYKAEDTKLKRLVALKFLPPHASVSEDDKARFIREAQAAAALRHPNICRVYEIDEVDGQTFIAMDYLRGKSLKEIVENGPLPIDDAVQIASQVADALEEANKQIIVHRDIKSANIMIDERGQATIVDFGLAKLSSQTQLTKIGTTVGTVAYMSPEQARGENVDTRTDVWALGIVMFEMLTGLLPFRSDFSDAVVYAIINEEIEPITLIRKEVPEVLAHVVAKALAKDPKERYQSPGELLVDLKRAEKGISGDAPSVSSLTGVAGGPRGASLIRHLIHRRVPQIVGLYLVIGYVVLQLIKWAVDRYPLSPNLPIFCLVLLASIIPTIALLAYFRGHLGRGGWTRVEKIGIPANILATIVLLVLLFQGKGLGATTTTVNMIDDEGNSIERVIPRAEFRKRIAIFYFENQTADSTYDWVQRGVVNLLAMDLEQDMYLSIEQGLIFQHIQAGFDDPVGSPLALKKKFAGDSNLNYFVTGSLTIVNGGLVITADLYGTKKGNRIGERTYAGGDIFKAVDSMSVDLRRDLGVPAYHIAETPDLDVSEIVTNSPEAFKLYSTATNAWERKQWEVARDGLEAAVEIDPTFAVAHFVLANVHTAMGQDRNAKRSLRSAMKHRYKLTEQSQFALENRYYVANDDLDASFQHAQRWVELYPHSILARQSLAAWYEWRNDYVGAIAQREKILENDPGRKDELQVISRLYEAAGNYEKALEFCERYVEIYPDKAKSFERLAELHSAVGDHERARADLKKLLLVEPDKVETRTSLALAELTLGNFAEAFEQNQRALTFAKSPYDSLNVYDTFVELYGYRGQITRAMSYGDTLLSIFDRQVPTFVAQFLKAQIAFYYVYAGREDIAFGLLDSVEAEPTSLANKGFIADAYLFTYAVLDDATYLEPAAEKLAFLESVIEKLEADQHRWRVLRAKGMIESWRGDFHQALQYYLRALEVIPRDETSDVMYLERKCGSCYRLLGDYVNAKEYFDRLLRKDPDPEHHYEMALLQHDMGNQTKAREHLHKALRVWADADLEYRPAKLARELLAEWDAQGSEIQ